MKYIIKIITIVVVSSILISFFVIYNKNQVTSTIKITHPEKIKSYQIIETINEPIAKNAPIQINIGF